MSLALAAIKLGISGVPCLNMFSSLFQKEGKQSCDADWRTFSQMDAQNPDECEKQLELEPRLSLRSMARRCDGRNHGNNNHVTS